ncbi:MAG TPA: hypothetical protein VF518_10690, partial [Polyangia bacterium]
ENKIYGLAGAPGVKQPCPMLCVKLAGRVSVFVLAGVSACATPVRAAEDAVTNADCPAGKGKTYEVGPQRSLQRLADVPWNALAPGDRVLIHWRPEPYREQILLSSRGTAEQPVRICGVPGPSGQLPIVTGDEARTVRALGFPYPPTQERGIVVVTLREGQLWGYKPGHLLLYGLQLRGGHPQYAFTDQNGKRRHFSSSAAALFIERGEHIVVRRCSLTDSANGFFVASGDSEQTVSRDILAEGNHIYGNGVAGSYFQHNAYTEAVGMVYQYNRFGALRLGAGGNALKDRSAGTVIRANWIEGGAHLLDLVEPEESTKITSLDPGYRRTYVYGNVLLNGPLDGVVIVHYGGDNGNATQYRKGTLFFYNNTVIVRGEEKTRWNTILFRLETNDETAEVFNNLVFREGSTHLSLADSPGRLRFGCNWVSEGFMPRLRPEPGALAIEGLDRLIVGRASPFANLDRLDLRARSGSDAARPGDALAPEVSAAHKPSQVYVPHQKARVLARGRALLGALE